MHFRYIASFLITAAVAVRNATACLLDNDAQKVANNFAALFSAYNETFANQTLAVDYTDYTDSVTWLINNATTCPIPYGSATFTSRRNLEIGQATQPNVPFQLLNVFHDCTHVFVRYLIGLTPEPVRGIAILRMSVLSMEYFHKASFRTGSASIAVVNMKARDPSNSSFIARRDFDFRVTLADPFPSETEVNNNSSALATQPYLIKTVYSEFNSGAWGVDIGLCHGTPPTASKTCP